VYGIIEKSDRQTQVVGYARPGVLTPKTKGARRRRANPLEFMIIGICGGTGSGKTTVANRILESVRADEVVFIQQDLYYRDLKDMPLDYRNAANFDHPDAVDNELLINHLKKLNAGEPV